MVVVAWTLAADGGESASGADGKVQILFEAGPAESDSVIRDSGAFDDAIRDINQELDLPTDLTVWVIDADTAGRLGIGGPFYEPQEETVYIPWSFVESSRKDLVKLAGMSFAATDRITNLPGIERSDADRLLRDAMVFVLLHEIAHGLIDILDPPVVAGEESVADSFAAIFSIGSRHEGDEIVLGVASLHAISAELRGEAPPIEYADDHGLSEQRAFNASCLVYGSSPADHEDLVGGAGDLPASRAELCPFEYANDLRAWRRLLAPWLTDEGGLLGLPD